MHTEPLKKIWYRYYFVVLAGVVPVLFVFVVFVVVCMLFGSAVVVLELFVVVVLLFDFISVPFFALLFLSIFSFFVVVVDVVSVCAEATPKVSTAASIKIAFFIIVVFLNLNKVIKTPWRFISGFQCIDAQL